jgi:uncharacterized transporter YbjL
MQPMQLLGQIERHSVTHGLAVPSVAVTFGLALDQGVVFSRLIRDQMVTVPTGETEVRLGDVYRAVGPRTNVAKIVEAMGRPAEPELLRATGDVRRMDLLVTRTQVLRRSLRDMDLSAAPASPSPG